MLEIRVLMLCVTVFALSAYAQSTRADTCTMQSSGDYHVGGNWNCGHAPGGSDTAIIPSGKTCTVTTDGGANQACLSFTVDSGGTLTINSGLTFSVGAASTLNGALTVDGKLAMVDTLTSAGTLTVGSTGNYFIDEDGV